MIKAYIKDKNTTSQQLAQIILWCEDELLMRELQFRSDHPECRRNENDPEWPAGVSP